MRAPHRRGGYDRLAAATRRTAYADPTYRCPGKDEHGIVVRCGLTIEEARAKYGRSVGWDADHYRSGDPTSPLVAICSHCNRSHGAALGNRRRTQGTTRDY